MSRTCLEIKRFRFYLPPRQIGPAMLSLRSNLFELVMKVRAQSPDDAVRSQMLRLLSLMNTFRRNFECDGVIKNKEGTVSSVKKIGRVPSTVLETAVKQVQRPQTVAVSEVRKQSRGWGCSKKFSRCAENPGNHERTPRKQLKKDRRR